MAIKVTVFLFIWLASSVSVESGKKAQYIVNQFPYSRCGLLSKSNHRRIHNFKNIYLLLVLIITDQKCVRYKDGNLISK